MQNGQSKTSNALSAWSLRRDTARRIAGYVGFAGVAALTVWSAILTKRAQHPPALANVGEIRVETAETARASGEDLDAMIAALQSASGPQGSDFAETAAPAKADVKATAPVEATKGPKTPSLEAQQQWKKYLGDDKVRWFNGRPVRPAKVVTMTVTGYSPDERSCGDSADGLTATLHSVDTNGGQLVAADPKVLPYGSMITVPGYDENRIVPVLDCGGAIKGKRLDLLFSTHQEARKWGVQKNLKVVVWEYADGKPADNPRKLR